MAKPKQKTSNQTEITFIYPEDVDPEIAYLNKNTCYSPEDWYNKECHICTYVERCIYHDKYKYRKI